MRYKLIFPLLLLSLLYACDTKRDAQRSIIPRPSIAYPDDDICFAINDKTKFILQTDDSAILAVVDSFAFWINQKSGFNLSKEKLNDQKDMANSILISTFQADTAIGQEGYKLRVSPEQVTIQATSYQGVFYAIQSLKQMTPPEVFFNNSKEIEWPT
ncbi:MAG TPA: glycoside hydrolase family 20 zincin-like fold domain-containing protein, partial [Bacteroidales bacterium]|nr:glycoside hydrolase family 20 zincin-like fold domain-containing protein [Bacteroidales bacterium]